MPTWRSFWAGLRPVLRAALVGPLVAAGVVGVVLIATMGVFDGWAHLNRVLVAWVALSPFCGLLYYWDGQRLQQVAQHLADKLTERV
jgi:hypothetical protein